VKGERLNNSGVLSKFPSCDLMKREAVLLPTAVNNVMSEVTDDHVIEEETKQY